MDILNAVARHVQGNGRTCPLGGERPRHGGIPLNGLDGIDGIAAQRQVAVLSGVQCLAAAVVGHVRAACHSRAGNRSRKYVFAHSGEHSRVQRNAFKCQGAARLYIENGLVRRGSVDCKSADKRQLFRNGNRLVLCERQVVEPFRKVNLVQSRIVGFAVNFQSLAQGDPVVIGIYNVLGHGDPGGRVFRRRLFCLISSDAVIEVSGIPFQSIAARRAAAVNPVNALGLLSGGCAVEAEPCPAVLRIVDRMPGPSDQHAASRRVVEKIRPQRAVCIEDVLRPMPGEIGVVQTEIGAVFSEQGVMDFGLASGFRKKIASGGKVGSLREIAGQDGVGKQQIAGSGGVNRIAGACRGIAGKGGVEHNQPGVVVNCTAVRFGSVFVEQGIADNQIVVVADGAARSRGVAGEGRLINSDHTLVMDGSAASGCTVPGERRVRDEDFRIASLGRSAAIDRSSVRRLVAGESAARNGHNGSVSTVDRTALFCSGVV